MLRKTLMLVLTVLVAAPLLAQFEGPQPSPKSSVMQRVGITDITITYSRPGVKGRTVWGDLVPYDKVWRTGANAATKIELSRDVKVNGSDLKAGTYSIHTIPTKGDWTIIFNSVAAPSGYSYDEKNDVLRVTATPKAGEHAERLTFEFPEVGDDKATVVIAWEKVAVPFTIEVDTKTHVMDGAKAQLDNWIPYFQAANYANGVGMKDDAMRWMDRSISIRETHTNLAAKARMLAEAGKKKEAIELAKKAVAVGKEAGSNTAATEKLIEEWSKK